MLALPEPPADRPVLTAWWRFARGVGHARKGAVDEAVKERAALAAAATRVPESALFGGTGLETARNVLTLATLVLDARIAWARGARDESIRLWTKAAAAADRLPYDEPPVWFYPIRESLGAALLLSGRPREAEQAFRDDLVRHPRNPRSLFGLRESLIKQGREIDANWIKAALDAAWQNADTTLNVETF